MSQPQENVPVQEEVVIDQENVDHQKTTDPQRKRKIKCKTNNVPITDKKIRKKRTHKWTEANKKSFYEKCVPARKASLAARKAQKESQTQQIEVM